MLLLWGAGCAHEVQLYPATPSQQVPTEKRAAWGEAGGVRVTAVPNSWHGDPHDLGVGMTPIEMRIENKSDAPLRVRYTEMSFETPTGFKLQPLHPYNIQAAPTNLQPGFAYSGFWAAPYYGAFYPGIPLWAAGAPWDMGYYYYGGWIEPLPTRDMVQRALPEGVVEAGGYVSGFVYFPELRSGDYSVNFRFSLHDANTGEDKGEVVIPFTVHS
jgi:hypothetical protein